MQQILESHEIVTPISDLAIQKSLNQLLGFLNLHQHAKNQFIQSIHS